jgi:hypothetical protein
MKGMGEVADAELHHELPCSRESLNPESTKLGKFRPSHPQAAMKFERVNALSSMHSQERLHHRYRELVPVEGDIGPAAANDHLVVSQDIA